MKDELIFLAIGFISGITTLLLLMHFTDSNVSRYKTAIAECEKSLPRDQYCKVIAVPIEKEAK